MNAPVAYRGSAPRDTRSLAAWHAAAEPVQVLEPDLPIVDPHHHLFGREEDRHHYRLKDLAADLASGHRVIATVYMEAYESGWRTTGPQALRSLGEVQMIVGQTAEPLATAHGACRVAAGIVSHVDVTLGAVIEEVVQAHLEAAQGRLRGVRHRTATDDGELGRFIAEPPRAGLMMTPAFREGVARMARHDLAFDAWIYHHQMDELIALADACPQTSIVVDHLAAPIGVTEYRSRREEVLAHWRDRVRALAARPNVFMKLGGMGMPVFGFGFEHGERPADAQSLVRAWQPLLDECLTAFGSGRCMFESNFPVDKQSCSYRELWNAFKLATQSMTAAERADLFHRTACRVYRLPDIERLASLGGASGAAGIA